MSTLDELHVQLADAQGKLRVAQAQLDEYRDSDGSSAARMTALEEHVAVAGRQVELIQLRIEHALVDAEEDDYPLDDGPDDNAPPPPEYESFETWAMDWLRPVWRRGRSQAHWCSRWGEHPEAVVTLTALWQSWELMRQDSPTSMAVWLRDYLDPLMRTLTGPEGTFGRCSTEHRPQESLDLEEL